MTVIDLPRFTTRQRRPARLPDHDNRDRTSTRSLLMLVLFLQGATLGVVIGGGLFTASMLSDLASRPALVAPVRPQIREVGW
jgi:hypothetical protein